jgi:hypothetical protein
MKPHGLSSAERADYHCAMARKPPPPPYWYQAFGNLSQIVSAIAAVGALSFVAYQVSLIEVNGRRANARAVYQAYSNASLAHPELIKPSPADYAAIRRDPVKFEQYKWYVAQMLFAYDEMISAAGDKSWLASFDYELPDHFTLLCDLKRSDPKFFTQFETNTVKLLDAAMKQGCAP